MLRGAASKSSPAALGSVFKAEIPSRGRLGYNVPRGWATTDQRNWPHPLPRDSEAAYA